MISPEYAAGFLDGEGMVTIYRRLKGVYGDRTDCYQLRVVINNTDLRPLLALRTRWGGTIKKLKRYAPHHRQRYNWTLPVRPSLKFLEDVLPFLIVKREVAEAGLELQRRNFKGRFGHVTPSEEAIRFELYSKVKELNHRGIREVHRVMESVGL